MCVYHYNPLQHISSIHYTQKDLSSHEQFLVVSINMKAILRCSNYSGNHFPGEATSDWVWETHSVKRLPAVGQWNCPFYTLVCSVVNGTDCHRAESCLLSFLTLWLLEWPFWAARWCSGLHAAVAPYSWQKPGSVPRGFPWLTLTFWYGFNSHYCAQTKLQELLRVFWLPLPPC